MAVVATPRALQRLDSVMRPRTSPLRSLWRRVVRRRSLVFTGVLATLLTALALTLMQDDRYRAESAIVLQRTPIDELLDPVTTDTDAASATARQVNNEIGVIEGVTVRSSVLIRLGLDDAPRAQASGDPDSDVIVVRVEAETAELAARLANAYVNAYIDVRSTDNLQLARTAATQMQEVIDGLDVQIADLDRQIASAEPTEADALVTDRAALADDLAEYTDRLRRLQLEAELGLPPAQVIASAEAPGAPFAPDRLAVLIAALAAGLALGLVVAFVVDALDDTIHHVEDIRRLTGVGPVLAAVPLDPAASSPPLPLVRSSDPAATAYRLLRNQIVAMGPTRRVVVVTGVRAGSGASTTAANLAIAFAEHGDRVVVLDADLRTPSVHRVFGVDGSLGLVDNLGNESIEMTALPLDERMTVIASGPVPPDPAALLATDAFAELIAALRGRYTYVVVDTPPVDAGPDAGLVARTADALVLVTGLGEDSGRDLQRCVRDLADTGAPLAGVVANRVQRPRKRAPRR